MIKIPGFLTVSLFIPALCMAQSYTYHGRAMGVNAGTLVVTRSVSSSGEQFEFRSNSKVNYLFGRLEVKHVTRVRYQSGVLQDAYVNNEKNGSTEYYSNVSYDGETYTTSTEKGKQSTRGRAEFSFVKLFFEEPVGRSQLFSERFGVFVPLKKIGEHKYQADLPNGDRYIYLYQNGQLVQFDVPSPVGKAHFYLKK